jgi:hypothetical protein
MRGLRIEVRDEGREISYFYRTIFDFSILKIVLEKLNKIKQRRQLQHVWKTIFFF